MGLHERLFCCAHALHEGRVDLEIGGAAGAGHGDETSSFHAFSICFQLFFFISSSSFDDPLMTFFSSIP